MTIGQTNRRDGKGIREKGVKEIKIREFLRELPLHLQRALH
jgi:hypothetical protein